MNHYCHYLAFSWFSRDSHVLQLIIVLTSFGSSNGRRIQDMAIFDPEQKARELLMLLRNGQSGIGDELQTQFRTMTQDQVAQTLAALKSKSIDFKPEYDSTDRVVGMTIPIADNLSMYLVTGTPVPGH
jgi:hypothetical protein